MATDHKSYTFTNILLFLLFTLAYFLMIKPKLTIEILSNPFAYASYGKSSQFMLVIYFLAIVILQFVINSLSIVNKCGGSATQNMGAAATYTFIPWLFIFGVVIAILLIFPGFKGAFSDVVGYFVVAGSANKLLTDLLVNTHINENGSSITPITPSAQVEPVNTEIPSNSMPSMDANMTGGQEPSKEALEAAADAIVKLCGNMSILINQIVPGNFAKYWDILTPLMKPQYQNSNSPETLQMKQKLLDIVVMRDNIGEACWYIYTGILLMSIVQFKLVTRGCTQNAETIMANYTEFDSKNTKEEETKAKQNMRQYVVE